MLPDLRYPVGKFAVQPLTPALIAQCIAAIEALPANVAHAVDDLGDAQLDTPYRPDGWTVRQVVHHLVDSHVNAWCRMRLALTEDNPTIRAYEEKDWADLPDARSAPIGPSLKVLSGLHARWAVLLKALLPDAWDRPFHHPESGDRTLAWLLQMYAWHGRHHTGHITGLRERQGW
ncbi:MAG: putative metal-dependent hydrolase [Gemmatimonadales bacterium]